MDKLKALATWSLPWYVRAPIMIGLVVLAFFAGKFTTPAEVQEIHTTEVKWKEKITTVDRTVKARTLVVYVDRVISPDGTIKEKSETREVESIKADTSSLVDRSGLRKEETSKVTVAQAKWRVGALVGASLTAPAIPITGPLVLGATVEMRIVGGVWVGAWVLTSGQAGGKISGEF
jgi:hypothetical protein